MAEIGGIIRKARKLQGMTQTTLGEMIGVSEPMISMWETGRHKPSRLEHLTALCRTLDLTASDLLGESDVILEETIPTPSGGTAQRRTHYSRRNDDDDGETAASGEGRTADAEPEAPYPDDNATIEPEHVLQEGTDQNRLEGVTVRIDLPGAAVSVIVDELAALRDEVAALRQELTRSRGKP